MWLWPVALGLCVATLIVFVARLTAHDWSKVTFGLLALQWAWAGVAYHAALFSRINPAAPLFFAAFIVEASLLTWYAVIEGRLQMMAQRDGSTRERIANGLILYGLIYPLLAIAIDQPYPRVPTFGVPCPTAIVTIGFLLLVQPVPFVVAAVPLLWAVIGGSAAFMLGMHVDFALIVAGFALGSHVFWPAMRRISVRVFG